MELASSLSHQPQSNNSFIRRQLVRVAYDYEYDYKTRKVAVKEGEILQLLQKTNEHWFKVLRFKCVRPSPGENKPFFVPALYVTDVNDEDNNEHNKKDEESDGNKKSSVCSWEGNKESPGSAGSQLGAKGESSKSKESSFFSFSKNKSKSSKINRNEGSRRSSHREKCQSSKANNNSKISSSNSSKGGKLKNWSASLEELSKQIVFPGLGSESVADLTFTTKERENENSFGRCSFSSFHCDNSDQQHSKPSINKCLTFRNPAFNKGPGSPGSTSEEKLELGSSNHDITASLPQEMRCSVNSMESDFMISRRSEGSITIKDCNLPDIPSSSPVRRLTDNWGEYYSPDSKRYFYYNSQTNITSWKPPRNSSSSKKSDEHLGSSLSDTNASSFEKSLDNIPDLVGSVGSPSLSYEADLSPDKASNSFSDNDNVTNTLVLKGSSGESRSSMSMKEDDNNANDVYQRSKVEELPIPEGWEAVWDESTQQICYVNKMNARWFTSTDSQGRVYYYEENSSNSSWFLPEASQQSQSPDADSKEPNHSFSEESGKVHENSSETLYKQSPVKKRHSAGEVADRSLKTKSLLITSDLRKQEYDKSSSLPRTTKSIWTNGKLNVVREGYISRSKITENGKKLRKSWAIVYAVLTEAHLSLFKDQKSFTGLTKTEIEIELEGGSVDWTEEKSSRKNVFLLSTSSDLQMLFQVDDKELASEWLNDIKHVTEKSDSYPDFSMRLRSTESPENLLDPSGVGERKISSRLNRNKSTKLRITTVDDKDKITIKNHLRKFFSRRPNRDTLVKKGIYKDESVFGCSLEKLCALEKGDVPRFVQECIVAIESKEENLKTDGIYRASGNLSQVQKIRLQVDQNNMACLFQEEDVHVLAGCLKLFFRELKEPLIPSELFEKALKACHATSKQEKIKKLREIVHSLKSANMCTLQALLRHLLKVASYSEFNRMQVPNLAIVFGPNLTQLNSETQNMATDLMQQNLLIESLMDSYDSIFQ